LARAAGDIALEHAIAAARDRVLVRERGKERAVERAQLVPCRAVRSRGRIVRARRHQHRELPRARLEGLVREGRVVGGDDVLGEVSRATVLTMKPTGTLDRLRETLPREERIAGRRISGGEERVGSAREAVGMLADEP
jgi:hypothetical protein